MEQTEFSEQILSLHFSNFERVCNSNKNNKKKLQALIAEKSMTPVIW